MNDMTIYTVTRVMMNHMTIYTVTWGGGVMDDMTIDIQNVPPIFI